MKSVIKTIAFAVLGLLAAAFILDVLDQFKVLKCLLLMIMAMLVAGRAVINLKMGRARGRWYILLSIALILAALKCAEDYSALRFRSAVWEP